MSLTAESRLALADGQSMPLIGFGTYQIKGDDVIQPVCLAIEAGYLHVDTAQCYANEEGVGKALRQLPAGTREKLYITTKLWPGNPDWSQTPLTYEGTIAACQDSIAKLGVTCVDLYLIHTPLGGGKEGRLAQYRACIECQKRGLCRSIGVSNFAINHIKELLEEGLPVPAANQIELHPYCQKRELLEYMAKMDIAPIAYSSLAPLSTWRDGQQSNKTDEDRAIPSPFAAIAANHPGWSEAKVLMRWALQRGFAILPKSTNPERIHANLVLFDGELTPEEMASLDALDRGQCFAFGKPGAPMDPTACD